MRRFYLSLFGAALSMAVCRATETPITDWPAYYECFAPQEYTLIILREDHTADFLMTLHDEKRAPWFSYDRAATWEILDTKNWVVWPKGKSCLAIHTSHFRIDYYFDGDQLVERDKMGDQRRLVRRTLSHP